MKPRTKLQKKVFKYSQELLPLSEYQKKQAIRKVAPHIAKLNSKHEYVCLDCGHSWKGDDVKTIVCPHCQTKLEVQKDRKIKHIDKAYFAIISKSHGFQVIRMFQMNTNLRKGEKPHYWFGEAFQR